MNKSSGNIPALTKCLLVEAVNELSEVRVLIVLVMFCNSDELVMNRFSFIFYKKTRSSFIMMVANQPTNAMKKLHVEAQKARM